MVEDEVKEPPANCSSLWWWFGRVGLFGVPIWSGSGSEVTGRERGMVGQVSQPGFCVKEEIRVSRPGSFCHVINANQKMANDTMTKDPCRAGACYTYVCM